MVFTDYWTFQESEIIFFWAKKLLENDIYWLLKSSCFEIFDDGK